MQIVFMFPGQSSRYPQMFDKLLSMSPSNRAIMAEASNVVGRDLAWHYSAANQTADEMYKTNLDVQLGVFIANHMFLQMLQEEGVEADLSLGLSLGEWNHLVHIGALTFAEALPAIMQRGMAYDAGPRGAMASFFPATLEELTPIIEQARSKGLLEAVNLNSPRQQVLAGDMAALEEALRLADDELYVEGVVIERQVPMHASSFAPVGAQFRAHLETMTFATPHLPYLPNRTAKFAYHPDKSMFVDTLSTHVHSPVLWRASVDMLMDAFDDLAFVEVGPKAVLYNLFDRKWHKGVKKFKSDTREETAAHLRDIAASLRDLRQPAVAVAAATTQPSVNAQA